MMTSVVSLGVGSALTGVSWQDLGMLFFPFVRTRCGAEASRALSRVFSLTAVNSNCKLHLMQRHVNGTLFALSAREQAGTATQRRTSEGEELVVSSRKHSGSEMRWINSSQRKDKCKSRPMRRNYRGSTAI